MHMTKIKNNLYRIELLFGPEVTEENIVISIITDDSIQQRVRNIYATYKNDTTLFRDYSVNDYGMIIGRVYSFNLDVSNFNLGKYEFLVDDQAYRPNYWSINDNSFFIVEPVRSSNECKSVYIGGNPKDSLNIVYMQDKYKKNQLGLFAIDVDENYKFLLKDPTIQPYEDKVNIYRVDSPKDLECKYFGDCINPFSEFLRKTLGKGDIFERIICCNEEKVHEVMDNCPNAHLALVLLDNRNDAVGSTQFGSPYFGLFSQLTTGLMEYLNGNVLKKERKSGIAISTNFHSYIMAHELGHLAGFLPDYYIPDPSCEEHQCRMCDPVLPFSSVPKCYDKQKMVKYLNQWCDAKVNIPRRNPASPYPNPVDLNEFSMVSVAFDVEYIKERNPCYALMEVFDSEGQLVDYVVSDEPVEDGRNILQWDGKDLEEEQVASGVYIYQVSIGTRNRNKDSVKGTVLK